MMLDMRLTPPAFALLALVLSQSAGAAVGLDRTRVIFDGGKDATSVSITNNNTQLPYLAQGWIEDEAGKKITSPLIVLPPVQRLEPGKQSQVKVQALPAAKSLPQDRETVYYFNLRETRRAAINPTPCKLHCRPASSCSIDHKLLRQASKTCPTPGSRN